MIVERLWMLIDRVGVAAAVVEKAPVETDDWVQMVQKDCSSVLAPVDKVLEQGEPMPATVVNGTDAEQVRDALDTRLVEVIVVDEGR